MPVCSDWVRIGCCRRACKHEHTKNAVCKRWLAGCCELDASQCLFVHANRVDAVWYPPGPKCVEVPVDEPTYMRSSFVTKTIVLQDASVLLEATVTHNRIVKMSSNVYAAGLRLHDVIVAVAERPYSADDLRKVVANRGNLPYEIITPCTIKRIELSVVSKVDSVIVRDSQPQRCPLEQTLRGRRKLVHAKEQLVHNLSVLKSDIKNANNAKDDDGWPGMSETLLTSAIMEYKRIRMNIDVIARKIEHSLRVEQELMKKRVEKTGEAVNDEEDAKECSICYSAIATHCSVPCGHRAYCESCSREIMQADPSCSICRQPCEKFIRVWG